MNDPRGLGGPGSRVAGSGPYESQGYGAPPYVDPAYADQTRYAPTYGGPDSRWAPTFNDTNATKELPRSWQYGGFPPGQPPPEEPASAPPEGPKSPLWLWIAAAAAVVLVVALVVALVIANGLTKQQSAISPLPSVSPPSSTGPGPIPSTGPSFPRPAPPTRGSVPPPYPSTSPGPTEPVVYNVTGEGRAMAIIYLDTGQILQHEFGVTLPWNKQVSLTKSPAQPASVMIIDMGHDVNCTITVAGVQVSQHAGKSMTFCQGTL